MKYLLVIGLLIVGIVVFCFWGRPPISVTWRTSLLESDSKVMQVTNRRGQETLVLQLEVVNSELKRDARQAAVDAADGQIAEVVNGYMTTESIRETGQAVEKYVEREMTPDSMTSEKLVKNIIKISRERARSHASMKLLGVTSLQIKSFKLPSGQVFYSATRVWKYSSLKAIQDFNSGKYVPEKPAAQPAAKPVKGQVYEGKQTNTLEDF